MLIENAWAQDAGAAAAGIDVPALIFSYAPLLLIVGVFYFLVIRPQAQQARAQADMLKALAKGDVVETQGGLIAVITKVGDKFVDISAGGGAMVLARGAIARKLTADEARAAGVKK